jgi:O-antigen/teichoic acid export membrane protein
VFGLHLALASLAVTLLATAPLLIAGAIAASAQVAGLGAMTQVVSYTVGAPLGLAATVAYPGFRKQWDDGQIELVRHRLVNLSLGLLCVAIAASCILAFADYRLISAIVGPAFTQPRTLAPLVLGTALYSLGILASWHHQLLQRATATNLRSWIGATAGFISTLCGTILFGVVGSAAGYLVGNLAYYLAQAWRTPLPSSSGRLVMLLAVGGLYVAFSPQETGWVPISICTGAIAVALSIVLVCRLLKERNSNA